MRNTLKVTGNKLGSPSFEEPGQEPKETRPAAAPEPPSWMTPQSSGMLFDDVGNGGAPHASLSPEKRGRRTAAGGSPSSLVLNLIFFGLVATATTIAFYGIGLRLLDDQEEVTATLDNDNNKNTNPLHREILPRLYDSASPGDSEAPPAKGTTEIPRAEPRIADGDSSASTTQVPVPPVTMEAEEDAASGSREAVRGQNPVSGTEIAVAGWGFGYSLEDAKRQALQADIMHGRRLYLWATLHGTQAAVDRLRSDHRLVMETHWARKSRSGPAAATERVMEVTIGGPGLASTFEEQVRRRGFFEWHSWTRKDALDPGIWKVSLTSSNGQVLLCGEDKQPCDFTINVE